MNLIFITFVRMEVKEIEETESRKKDHIKLAFESQVDTLDKRFYYEPILDGHPQGFNNSIDFLGKKFNQHYWISSMTGGTAIAKDLNKILARSCKKFGFGMGLGSCRIILDDKTYFEDFNLRPVLGDGLPFFANIGIAQLEELINEGSLYKLDRLVADLDCDGLIIHINPLQEWTQPEGDRYHINPIEAIERTLQHAKYPIIVKEVGQGMGYESLKALFQMPLAAVDFGAHGGTNFSLMELLRGSEERKEAMMPLTFVGHSAEEMVGFTNQIVDELGDKRKCNQVIVSGGVKDYLDGYYHVSKLKIPAIYGQAAPVLKRAIVSEEKLNEFLEMQFQGFSMAKKILKVR